MHLRPRVMREIPANREHCPDLSHLMLQQGAGPGKIPRIQMSHHKGIAENLSKQRRGTGEVSGSCRILATKVLLRSRRELSPGHAGRVKPS